MLSMGQDITSCGTTQIDESNSSTLILVQIYKSAWITGTVPVGSYSLALSSALISPFTLRLIAVLTPLTTR